MAKYEKKGRYDDAIISGLAWTEKHPEGIDSQWIYRDLSFLYLKKASLDDGHKEGYVDQALFYRDKLLAFSSDSPGALEPLETISEYAGNISTAQKCAQYRNSIKLLDRMNSLVSQDKERLAREFKPDPKEEKETECLSDWIEATAERVNHKLTSSGCTH